MLQGGMPVLPLTLMTTLERDSYILIRISNYSFHVYTLDSLPSIFQYLGAMLYDVDFYIRLKG